MPPAFAGSPSMVERQRDEVNQMTGYGGMRSVCECERAKSTFRREKSLWIVVAITGMALASTVGLAQMLLPSGFDFPVQARRTHARGPA